MAVDLAGYELQRRNLDSDYAAKTAAGNYGRFVAQQRGARTVGDLARQFTRGWPKVASSWGARGMTGPNVGSGFYQQAMQNYLGDYQRTLNDTNQDIANQNQQFDLDQASNDAAYQRAIADLEAQKTRDIANLAQNIQAIKPSI